MTGHIEAQRSPLWGLTTHFNPSRYRTRLDNYRAFRESSRAQGLPLVTIELSPEGLEHELGSGDAEILVQRTSPAVLWHKERLLTLGLEALPRWCEQVCWLDADVIFEDRNWVRRAIGELERYAVIQPFEHVLRPRRPGPPPPSPRTRLGWRLLRALPTRTVTSSFCSRRRRGQAGLSGTTGYAWCARREVLDRHGFYDRCVVGGGDREIALAFVLPSDRVPDSELRIRHRKLRNHIARWHDAVFADVRGALSYLDGAIRHLWHGEAQHRGYTDRHAILERHDFDPERDIVLDEGGCWCWAEGTEALAEDVRAYFRSRREDGHHS